MNKENIEVYFADDHEIVAKAIADLLLKVNGIKTVRTFSNGKDLYEACLKKLPDLVILDMEMPLWSGIDTLKKIKQLSSVPVIILSMNDEKTLITECIKEGAKGYLHKNCTMEELERAIQSIKDGNIFLSNEINKVVVGIKQTADASNILAEPLTEKEYEVLVLVCEGLTSKEIGEKLFISSRTVETRKNNLMQKFNVQSTGKLVAAAIKSRIIK